MRVQTLPGMALPRITAFRGLHNVGSPLRRPMGALTRADNVNITDTGAIERRAGYQPFAGMSAVSGVFATDDGERLYAVDAGTLKVVHADGSADALAHGLGTQGAQWAQFNDQVLFLAGAASGIITADHAVLPWRWDIPAMAQVRRVAGALDAGQYGVAITHVLPDGRETGPSPMVWLDLAPDSALDITVPTPPPGCTAHVYVQPANSTVLQWAGATAGGLLQWGARAHHLGHELGTQHTAPLPEGADVLALWRARACVAVYLRDARQSAIFMSQPLAPHLFDLSTDFFMVPGRVTALAAHDSALVVATLDAIRAYDGERLAVLADYGAPPGCPHAMDHGRMLLWTHRGVCQFPEFTNLTQRALSVAPGAQAHACVMEHDGQTRLIVATQPGGPPAYNPRL